MENKYTFTVEEYNAPSGRFYYLVTIYGRDTCPDDFLLVNPPFFKRNINKKLNKAKQQLLKKVNFGKKINKELTDIINKE